MVGLFAIEKPEVKEVETEAEVTMEVEVSVTPPPTVNNRVLLTVREMSKQHW